MGKLGGEASTELDASIDEVWDVVVDIETAPDWQDGFEDVEVLERDDEGRVLIAETESDAKVKTVRNRLRFSYEEPNLVEWRQEKGDLKSLVGAWELEDLGDGRTKATYRLEGDPGRMLGMLIRGPVEGQIRKILVEGRPGELAERMGA
jgi:ribosome-associated toxin RatA of RatAB toxin-antitoxin module